MFYVLHVYFVYITFKNVWLSKSSDGDIITVERKTLICFLETSSITVNVNFM